MWYMWCTIYFCFRTLRKIIYSKVYVISFVKVPSDRDLTSEGAGNVWREVLPYSDNNYYIAKRGCVHSCRWIFSIHTQSRKLQEMIIDLEFRNQDLHSFIMAGKWHARSILCSHACTLLEAVVPSCVIKLQYIYLKLAIKSSCGVNWVVFGDSSLILQYELLLLHLQQCYNTVLFSLLTSSTQCYSIVNLIVSTWLSADNEVSDQNWSWQWYE